MPVCWQGGGTCCANGYFVECVVRWVAQRSATDKILGRLSDLGVVWETHCDGVDSKVRGNTRVVVARNRDKHCTTEAQSNQSGSLCSQCLYGESLVR